MKGLVISCTVALEANSIPTLMFSLSSVLVDLGQLEEFRASSAAAAVGVGEGRSAALIVVLEFDNLTVLSYKDTMLWKDPEGSCCDTVLFLDPVSTVSSMLYR